MSNGTRGSRAVCELGVTCLPGHNAPKSTEWEKHWAVTGVFWQDLLRFPLTFNPTPFTWLEIL